jgi:trans-aconitate methyltransferase
MNLNYYQQNAQYYYERTALRIHSAWPRWIQSIRAPIEDAIIVDLGSGAGATLKFLHECGSKKSFGIDYSSELNRIVKLHSPDLQIITKDMRLWQPDVQSLDAAFLSRVIDELNPSEIQRILGALFKGLKSKSPLWIDFLNTDIADIRPASKKSLSKARSCILVISKWISNPNRGAKFKR